MSGPFRVGGIVLCGGRSSRMGQPKALLPIGSELMLTRVVRLMRQVVEPIAIVAAADQELPDLSHAGPSLRIVRDTEEYRGPLAGLANGLRALSNEVDAVYVTACDTPLLQPALINAMIAELGESQIAVPFDGQFHHPLAAVYRANVLPLIDELLAADRLRPVFLFERAATQLVPLERLRTVDPELETFCNANTPEEYAQLLTRIAAKPSLFPSYTHIPRVTPHPLNDPAGHSYGQHRTLDPVPAGPIDELWVRPSFQRGRELFNHGYYWEAHEEWEGLWVALGRCGVRADLIKGFIKYAAAGVKLREHQPDGFRRHLARAIELWESAAEAPVVAGALFTAREQLRTEALLRELPEALAGRPIRLLPDIENSEPR